MDNYDDEFIKLNKELEKEISNKSDLKIAKSKLNKLYKCMSKNLSNNEETIIELVKNQRKMKKDIEDLKYTFLNLEEEFEDSFDDLDEDDEEESIKDFQGPFEENDSEYEFEITCPYCKYSFIADRSFENEEQVTCPKCKKIIDLDWSTTDDDNESNIDEYEYPIDEKNELENISSNESSSIYSHNNKPKTLKRSSNSSSNKNVVQKNDIQDNKKNIENNNEDDM